MPYLLDTRFVDRAKLPEWKAKRTGDEEPPFADIIDRDEFKTAFSAGKNDRLKALIQEGIKLFSGYVLANYTELKEQQEIEIKKSIKESKVAKSQMINQRLEILETEGSNKRSTMIPEKLKQLDEQESYDEVIVVDDEEVPDDL